MQDRRTDQDSWRVAERDLRDSITLDREVAAVLATIEWTPEERVAWTEPEESQRLDRETEGT